MNDIEKKIYQNLNSAFTMIKTVNQFISMLETNKVSSKTINLNVFQLTLLAESLYENSLMFSCNPTNVTSIELIHQIEFFSSVIDQNEKEITIKMQEILSEIKVSRAKE
jgi:hypothetical protein